MKRNKSYKRWIKKNKREAKKLNRGHVSHRDMFGTTALTKVEPKKPTPIQYNTAGYTLAQLDAHERMCEDVITQCAKQLDHAKKGVIREVVDRQFKFLKCIIKERIKRDEDE